MVSFSRMISLEGSEARLQMVQHAVVVNDHVCSFVSVKFNEKVDRNSVELTRVDLGQ